MPHPPLNSRSALHLHLGCVQCLPLHPGTTAGRIGFADHNKNTTMFERSNILLVNKIVSNQMFVSHEEN